MPDQARVTTLLLLNGLVLAGHTLLARQAAGVGVPPIVYALAGAGGAALVLSLSRLVRPTGTRMGRAVVIYGLVAGLISTALPQVLIYSASAYVGAGIASLAYAFPTPLTYVLAAGFGIERASLGRTIGIGIAFGGAILLAAGRAAGIAGDGFWVALAMLAPISIAFGNIYRTRFWPAGSVPRDLAVAMSAAGALWLAAAIIGQALVTGAGLPRIPPAGLPYLGAAALLAAFGNLIYFQLQKSGGIVSFSQIGYVGAVFGLFGGFALLGERYGPVTWIAALTIAAGILISEALKRRAAPQGA